MEAQIALRSYQRESICHSHDQYHQIIYPLTGVLQLRLGLATGYVQRRMFANIEASTEHEFSATEENEFLVLDLPCDIADNITTEITDGRQKTFYLGRNVFQREDDRLKTAFKLTHLCIREQDNSRIMQEALLRCLISSMLHNQSVVRGAVTPDRKQVSAALEYIRAYYTEDVTVQNMADTVGLGVSQFHRVFMQQTGKTPLTYLTEVRMQEAEQLLRLTEQSVLNICLAVGYQSPATFSRLFRSYFGDAPSEYRRNRQENKREMD
jgi:AraC-like DNA-binding protein